MKKLLTAFAFLTAIGAPAFAQSFDPEIGTGNVLSLSSQPNTGSNAGPAVAQSGQKAFAMRPSSLRAKRHASHGRPAM